MRALMCTRVGTGAGACALRYNKYFDHASFLTFLTFFFLIQK